MIDWNRLSSSAVPPPLVGVPEDAPLIRVPRVRTELSATVFSGTARDWVHYLELSREQRYDPLLRIAIRWSSRPHLLEFVSLRPEADALTELLNSAFAVARQRLESKPNVLRIYNRLIFGNRSNKDPELSLRVSPVLPADASREAELDERLKTYATTIVLSQSLVEEVLERASRVKGGDTLGGAWPLFSRTLSQLAYPARPRDRFVEKVRVMARHTYVAVNLLYKGRSEGRLVPTRVGERFEQYMAQESGIPQRQLMQRHAYFKLLSDVGYVLRAEPYKHYSADVRTAVREFLDGKYLRLSLSGVMPEVAPNMAPMEFTRKKKSIRTPSPRIGIHGVIDKEDLRAWKKVDRPLRKLGFTPLRQLGIGEFGRVYEALNQASPDYPERVAIKIDRIIGSEKRAILDARASMALGRDLAEALHVIRIYDAGKLRDTDYTYHVLQLIDGDTLDNLVGVTGTEHRSVSRPPAGHARSAAAAKEEYLKAMSGSETERWRRRYLGATFVEPLSPAMALDLLTSVLLWIEEVHARKYAINDLKNGNVMMSRRGQVKGIDLDTYSVVHSPLDKNADFMFLAVSLLLLLLNAPLRRDHQPESWHELLGSPAKLHAALERAWPRDAIDWQSEGRVVPEEMLGLFADLVRRSHSLEYASDPGLFSADIARLIQLKYRYFRDEIVLD